MNQTHSDYFVLSSFTTRCFLVHPLELGPALAAFRSAPPSFKSRARFTFWFAALMLSGLLVLPSSLDSSSAAAISLSGDVLPGSYADGWAATSLSVPDSVPSERSGWRAVRSWDVSGFSFCRGRVVWRRRLAVGWRSRTVGEVRGLNIVMRSLWVCGSCGYGMTEESVFYIRLGRMQRGGGKGLLGDVDETDDLPLN